MDLAKVFAPGGNSLQVVVEFIRNGGSHQRVTVVQPANSSYALGGIFSTFTGTYTFPTDAVKLVATAVEITGNGSFKADNLSLSGPFTAGPVPVITSVTPEHVHYNSPITLTGSDLGDSPGTLTLNGGVESLVIDSWSPTSVVCHLTNPNHGGLLGLETEGVMASQNHQLTVLSPHYVVATSKTTITALPGQRVELDALVAFYNNFTTSTGIALTVPGSGSATSFTPLPLKHQGGSRLYFDTTGLAPGVYNHTIESTDGITPGNPVPLQLRVHASDHLAFTYGNRDFAQPLPPGTLGIASNEPVTIFYRLFGTDTTDITQSAPLQWSISDPTVLEFKLNPGTGTGPTLYPLSNGPCTLSYATVDGLTGDIPIDVTITSSTITDIGFTSNTMDNSGVGSNRFHAKTDGFSDIYQISYQLQVVNPIFQYPPGTGSGIMDFSIAPGQAPGLYEFTAENNDIFSPARRSALLTVVNVPGTGVVTGSVTKTVSFNATPAGDLEFYDTTDGQLAFSRTIAGYGPFQIGALPPASYRLRFVPRSPGIELDAPWYPNATSFNEALPVLITADTTTPDLHFFVFSIPPPTAEIVVPEILSISRVGTSFGLSFKTEAGLQYVIEYSESLAAGSWSQLDAFAGDGGTAVFVDPGAASTKRFYRVKVTGL